MPDIARALEIPGWMTEAELLWLAESARRSSCIAEIGSWRGRSTTAMATNSEAVIFCIDPWSDEAVGFPGWWTKKESPEKYKQKNWLWSEFEANLAGYIGKKIIPLRMFSAHAFDLLSRRGMTFDMIFIDGSHDAGHVRGDILMFRRLLKSGGILSGHDYGEPSCPEVAPTVSSLLPNLEVVGTIWKAT